MQDDLSNQGQGRDKERSVLEQRVGSLEWQLSQECSAKTAAVAKATRLGSKLQGLISARCGIIGCVILPHRLRTQFPHHSSVAARVACLESCNFKHIFLPLMTTGMALRYLLIHPRQMSVCYQRQLLPFCPVLEASYSSHSHRDSLGAGTARTRKVCDFSSPCRDQMEQDLTRLQAEVADNKKGQTATQDSLQQVKQQERTLSTDLKIATQSLAAAVQAKDRLEREVRGLQRRQ